MVTVDRRLERLQMAEAELARLMAQAQQAHEDGKAGAAVVASALQH